MNEETFNVKTVSVIGLGKLGAPMVACCASRGYSVIGVDLDPEVVCRVNAGVAPVVEPGLDELLQAGHEQVSATQDTRQAVLDTDLTFIVVPTPSEPDGRFSTQYVLEAAEPIGDALREKSGYHLVVLTSTVLPGATGGELKPLLEARSGKQCGVDFGLCYNPEFIALGNVIHGMLNPDFVLLGESDPRAGAILASFYKILCENDPPIARMNFVNAELAKISVNSYVTMKISFANNLAEICERLPDADVEVVASAIGLDSRIGRKYIKGALGYGGPCFPRDNVAFVFMARQAGASPTMAEATDTVNRRQVERLVDTVTTHLPEGGRVGVLGLSYKPDTNVVEESQGLQLAQALANMDIPTTVYDPLAMDNARAVLREKVTCASSLEACIQQADVVVLATPWTQFQAIQPELLARNPYRRVLIDCWRLLDPETFGDMVKYVALGSGKART